VSNMHKGNNSSEISSNGGDMCALFYIAEQKTYERVGIREPLIKVNQPW